MIIYLIGYMGSGKSTIGKLLADALQFNFIDFDTYLEEKEQKTIPEIFETKGEIYFRKKEIGYLKELLSSELSKTVVSLGGGTPCYGDSMQQITNTNAHSIYFNVPVQTLVNRLWEAKQSRPLVAAKQSKAALEDYTRKHLFERSYFYNQARQVYKVKENETVNETVEALVATLF